MIKDYLAKDAANDVIIGPFIDETDGKSPMSGLTFVASDIKVLLPGASDFTSVLISGSLTQTDLLNGFYKFTFISSNFATAGKMEFWIVKAGALPVRRVFEVRKKHAVTVVVGDVNGTAVAIPGSDVFDGESAGVKVTPNQNYIVASLLVGSEFGGVDKKTSLVTNGDGSYTYSEIAAGPVFYTVNFGSNN